MTGAPAAAISRAASPIGPGSGAGRRTCQVRGSKKRSGQSNASDWTSSGSEIVTAPVSDRVGQDAEGRGQRGEELLRARDAIEVAGHRAERVVGADVTLVRVLDLLEHRVGRPVGKGVAREEQHRDPVDRRPGGAGDHVRCPRADRGDAGEGTQAVVVLRECVGEVDLGLLVLRPVVGQAVDVAVLLDRLAQAGDVAMPEDPPHAGDEALPATVPFHVLRGHEPNDGLTYGQSHSPHRRLLAQPIALTVSSRLVPRQHARRA